MKIPRSTGALIHITSFPGKYGSGTLGPEAFEVIDLLEAGGFSYLQILPIGPVSPSMGYSPYATTSTFAGNPLFISVEKIEKKKWFRGNINTVSFDDAHFINFEKVQEHRAEIFNKAFTDFKENAQEKEKSEYAAFKKNEDYWLDDFSLYTAVAEEFDTNYWPHWERETALKDPDKTAYWKEKLKERIEYNKFIQFLFFQQWFEFRSYAHMKGIQIIGDIPIYMTLQGADSWGNHDIVQIHEETGEPVSVSGVPPDYFSKTGQRWGNPLYRWFNDDGTLNEKTIDWWTKRIAHLHRLVDIIRIDHFRAFESFWAIPANEEFATNGEWEKGPGLEFFKKLKDRLGELPLIAEDLGVITPKVEKLRDDLCLPGMKILQFAFDFDKKNYYLPHNYTNENCIVYTGTHDNNTTNGWFYGDDIDENTRKYILEYIGTKEFSDIHLRLTRLAFSSVAELAIIPAQDILGYGEEFRMNKPGTIDHNWKWKLKTSELNHSQMKIMRRMAEIYNRIS